jgi:hypothetical protein
MSTIEQSIDVDLRVKGDLPRFKEFIETLGSETGAWRGTVTA